MAGQVVAVCTGRGERFAKTPVAGIELLANVGVDGDRHAGRNRSQGALLVPDETYTFLLSQGLTLPYGSLAENIVVRNVPLMKLAPGTPLSFYGGVTLELTDIAPMCRRLTEVEARLPKLLQGRRGRYARVVGGGSLQPGFPVRVEAYGELAGIVGRPELLPTLKV